MAMSFCRGLSTIHMRGAGIARRGAEVWKCLQRDTTVVSRGEDLLGAELKHKFLPFLQRSAGPVAFVFLRQLTGHSGPGRCSFEIWKFRFTDAHKTIRWFRKKLPRSKAIVMFHIKLAPLMVKNLRRCNNLHKSWCRYFQLETSRTSSRHRIIHCQCHDDSTRNTRGYHEQFLIPSS